MRGSTPGGRRRALPAGLLRRVRGHVPRAACNVLRRRPVSTHARPPAPKSTPHTGSLGALHAQLENGAPAERGAQRAALAVASQLHVARPALAQPVDSDLPQSPSRELERDELYSVGLGVFVVAGRVLGGHRDR